MTDVDDRVDGFCAPKVDQAGAAESYKAILASNKCDFGPFSITVVDVILKDRFLELWRKLSKVVGRGAD
ncbi:hypothetical protein HYS54_04120 [Candidatus Micrarchaeota archaeon]|nr:hypothetical protein [Candidatus Micrarchaeota archaeon]